MWFVLYLLLLGGLMTCLWYHVLSSVAQFEKLPQYLDWPEIQRVSTRTEDGLFLKESVQHRRDVAHVYMDHCERREGFTDVHYYKRIPGSARFEKKQLSLLHLVLYSENVKEYKDMYMETSRLYHNMNIETLYYTFRTDQQEPFVLEGDILYIKGQETYVPGILDKTIRTLAYTHNRDYEYVIRSNISTVVNFQVLLNHFLARDLHLFHYGGPQHLSLSWLDTAAGIVDATYWGLEYIGGTCMILSRALVTRLLQELQEHIPYHLVDDTALGYVVKHHTAYQPQVMAHLQSQVCRSNLPKILSRHLKDIACYRNKSRHRTTDVKHIQAITRALQHHEVQTS